MIVDHRGVVAETRTQLIVGDRRVRALRSQGTGRVGQIGALQGGGPGVEQRLAVRLADRVDQVFLAAPVDADVVVVLDADVDAELGRSLGALF